MELETIFRVLARKWYIILPIFLITLIATVLFTRNQPRIYEAKATYVAKLTPTALSGKDFANILDILSSRVEIPSTYAEIANSRNLYTATAQKLGLPSDGRHNMTVNSRLVAGTNIIEIDVQGTDPVLASNFANTLGQTTIDYVQNLYETFTLAPLDAAVTPSNPIQPNVPLNLAFGAVLGLILGVIIALLIHYFQTMGKDPGALSSVETGQGISSAQDASVIKLQQDLAVVQDQYRAIKLILDQIQVALRKNNSYPQEIRSVVHSLDQIHVALRRNNTYTQDIRTVVHSLEGQIKLNGNHENNGQVRSGKNSSKDEI